ncbi:TraI/MobA(P) family conjugative relaxase [Desulfovibrio sp. TomC]|uniref:TraI/MobA(P) family conjugative relaxase n=1 Tax=Desulfovibrio sp. TomC TaxID=1562888 RepID=UPI000574EB46|nr:TraI/MobA(P) family conjugative relaxase [Desulfovibrio sp. TomC]KHK02916.1 IncP-type DNA relaxase TraI [Desulfovibrio sp. TomC]
MISRRIARKPGNDNYRRLAKYIADASRDGEKCLLTWCIGCWADDDYELAVQEVSDTQELNTRTTKEKTYHLIVSFRPEDEMRLTPEVLKAIEAEFAKALGFEEHQRHCGVHKNTANLHMHVAYNMIHPERLTRHEPFRDYRGRDRVCRELEKRFGLAIDNGRDQTRPQERPPLSDEAANVEAHTGQQSFEGYARGHRETILASLEKATGWQSLHQTLALYGLKIKPHGNGLVIKDRHGKRTIKASSLDRSLAMGRLEKRLGPFKPPDMAVTRVPSQDQYQAKPLHRGPERGNLFAEYQTGIARRKEELAALKQQGQTRREAIALKWERIRQEIEDLALTRRDRFALLKQLRQHEAKTKRRFVREVAFRRQKLAEAIPYASWSAFLRWQAAQGNETALAILRSRKDVVEPEQADTADASPQAGRSSANEEWQGRRQKILNDPKLKPGEKRTLLSVARMRYLEALEATKPDSSATLSLQGFTHSIDDKGTVLFTLPGGGLIRDMGDQVLFSAHDPTAEKVAVNFSRLKLGNSINLKENYIQLPRIINDDILEKERAREKWLSLRSSEQ